MTSWMNRLLRKGTQQTAANHTQQHKNIDLAPLLAMHALGPARWTNRSVIALTHEGYERNAIVYRAVRMIVESAASIPWTMFIEREELTHHPVIDLITRPNPAEEGTTFLEGLYTHLLLFGNAYVEANRLNEKPVELYCLRPDRVTIEARSNGWPLAYEYRVGAHMMRYPVNEQGLSDILHLKLFNPLDDHYGFAPLQAAQMAIDIHNAASFWNKALLDNAARPSGALVYAPHSGASLTRDQFDRLKSELEESFSGARNAGRPLLLEGGLDWKALSLSPRDMDFVEAKAIAAREIALAFGVPPMLMGIPGDNTYSNYQEAHRAFWRQTIIPLVARSQKSLSNWLQSDFGAFRFDYDVDRIEALAGERAAEWDRIGKADFLTPDEKRQALGYGKDRIRRW